MDKVNAIRLLEKYKNISQILGLREDEELLDELIDMVDKYDGSIEKGIVTKKSRRGEADFQQMILERLTDLSKYELNAILYLISPQYNKYQKKDKQKIIRFINQVVREKRQEDSYRGIKV